MRRHHIPAPLRVAARRALRPPLGLITAAGLVAAGKVALVPLAAASGGAGRISPLAPRLLPSTTVFAILAGLARQRRTVIAVLAAVQQRVHVVDGRVARVEVQR